jgi:4-hydroxybenzoate polyprenyltransferase
MLSEAETFIDENYQLFSVVRGYNIPVITSAVFSAIFIITRKGNLANLLDLNLFLFVLASSITIASGYIINNFTTAKRLINRPKIHAGSLVSQKQLSVYFT